MHIWDNYGFGRIGNTGFPGISSLNRPFHSQTDLFGTKILTPQFFLENILALCPKVGGSENFPPLDPLGPQNPYLGVRPPKPEKLLLWPYFARKIFLPFGRSCKTLCHIHTSPKKMDPAFFWSIFDPKTPKKGQK